METLNLSKSYDFFKPEEVKERIHIIGCGSVGSAVAELLVRFGLTKLMLYDFDTVEPKNLANQLYTQKHVGSPKVDALADMLGEINSELTGCKIGNFVDGSISSGNSSSAGNNADSATGNSNHNSSSNSTTGNANHGENSNEISAANSTEIAGNNIRLESYGYAGQRLSGYVFLCVDNIELRREIAIANKHNHYIKAMFDFRTRLTDAQHYAANWSDMKMVDDFVNSMNFSHEEAVKETPVSACNVMLSVAPTIRIISSLGVANFINFTKGAGLKKFIQVDAFGFMLDAF